MENIEEQLQTIIAEIKKQGNYIPVYTNYKI